MLEPTLPIYVDLTLRNVSHKARLEKAMPQMQRQYSICKIVPAADDGNVTLHGICAEQLDAIVGELRHGFSIPFEAGIPQIAYRETITCGTTVDYIFRSDVGATTQFVQLKLQFDPLDAANGFHFKNLAVGLPDEFVSAMAKGFDRAKAHGTIAGFPCIGLQVSLMHCSYSGSLPASVIANAATAAFLEGFTKAKPVVLQPVMQVRVGVPLQCKEAILEDLTKGNSKIQNIIESDKDDLGKAAIIHASIPLAEMQGFTNWLAANTRGLGQYSMQFEDYAPIQESNMPDDSFPSAVGMRQVPYTFTKLDGNSGNGR